MADTFTPTIPRAGEVTALRHIGPESPLGDRASEHEMFLKLTAHERSGGQAHGAACRVD